MLQGFEYRTPESVTVSQPVAGIGSRGLAGVVDTVVILLIILAFLAGAVAVSGYTLNAAPAGGALIVLVVVASVVPVAYYVLWEVATGGRSLGKAIFGLRVVDRSGVPLTPADSLVRNVVRILDFLPFLYGIGVVAMFAGSQPRRLGDLAAGTLVVHDPGLRRLGRGVRVGPGPRLRRTDPGPPISGAEACGRPELSLLEDLLARSELSPRRRQEVALELVRALERRPGVVWPGPLDRDPLDLLERLYLQLRQRLIESSPPGVPARPVQP